MLNKKPVKGLIGICAAAALCATLGVQAQTTGTQSGSQGGGGQTGTQGSTASGAGGSGTGTISSTDRKIVTDLAMANMAEIEVARTAQGKSQDDQVKKYAQQMIDDHTKALNEVQQLAQTRGITLPATLDRAHKARADKLAALSGDAFDRAYMAQAGVAEHKKTHGMLTRAQARAKDGDVKALVMRMTPTVEQHLNAAQELHGNKNTAMGNSRTGTEKSGQ
ncbi:DUF4142 domain-containing protein [Massilia antarctica]|uniref:DUF4142 domain-containing protein n=1 Tax=Massilia antarctica TaxID=2765360 RepID=A0AA48WI69_9BURK|nr:DUF4142 domain-containing protein [Massilia antarctica]QPI52064.1 DUF4142 domain-containing protein [Massilia antarctica]